MRMHDEWTWPGAVGQMTDTPFDTVATKADIFEVKADIAEIKTELKTELKWIKLIGGTVLAALVLLWLVELISGTMS